MEEMDRDATEILENLPDIHIFHLTNRIRTNAELSSFILNIMHIPDKKVPRYYPHIEVVCANDKREAENLLKDYLRQGYQYFPEKRKIPIIFRGKLQKYETQNDWYLFWMPVIITMKKVI